MPAPKKSSLRDDMYKSLVELPLRSFMYTTDQIAHMLDMNEATLKNSMLYYTGREARQADPEDLRAINIRKPRENPEWRISEEELMRWLRKKRIKFSTPNKINASVRAR